MTAESYPFMRLRADVGRDIDTYLGFAAQYHAMRPGRRRRLSALLMPSVLACALYRLSHWLHRDGWRRAALAVARINLAVTRVSINPASRIGPGLYIAHPSTGIVFQGEAGAGLKLFAGCAVTATAFSPLHAEDMRHAPRLGDDVALGAKSFIFGPVEIGSGARIGFNACVTRDLPPGAVAVAATVRNRVRSRGQAG